MWLGAALRSASMARTLKSDKPLYLATLALLFSSLVMVYSASAVVAGERHGQPYFFLYRQIAWLSIGVSLLVAVMRVDYRLLKRPAVVWTVLGLTTAALIAVLFGPSINGTRRWFGIAGFGVQPSELAKLTVILFVAAFLDRRMARVDEFAHSLLPLFVVTGGVAGLILMGPDFGTAFTLLLIVTAMVFTAGLSYRYFIGIGLVALPAIALVMASAGYRRRRMFVFLNPWADPLDSGFQLVQSQIAVGTGGLFGRGVMGGVQKLFFLPEPHTDFIYAVIAEETGLIGATAIVLCFAVILWRGLRVTRNAPDQFGAFLAFGITVMLALQAFMNMSVVLSLMPTTGLPLPFVSFGGSSLMTSLLGMAVLLNISQHASAPT